MALKHLYNNLVHQNEGYFYNDWRHNRFVTSVFCFFPDGTIPIAHMNLPGATHNSRIADWGGIYNKLDMTEMVEFVVLTPHFR